MNQPGLSKTSTVIPALLKAPWLVLILLVAFGGIAAAAPDGQRRGSPIFTVSGGGFDSTGFSGGPVNPTCTNYTLTNHTSSWINWGATTDVPWVEFFPSGGSIAPHSNVFVEACFTTGAQCLPAGLHTGTLTFQDQTNTQWYDRGVSLTISAAADCNENGIDDSIDVNGPSADLNSNGVPDECEGEPDVDGDGKPDACESTDTSELGGGVFTNGLLKDSDGDGLEDGQEAPCDCYSNRAVLSLSNPRDWDTDEDGWGDGLEVLYPATFPNGPLVADLGKIDVDGDGVPSAIDVNDSDKDSDNDFRSDAYEMAYGTNPSSNSSWPSAGDVNNDDTIDVSDVATAADANLEIASMAAPWNSDMNFDGLLDITDVAILADLNLGLAIVGP